MSKPTIAEIEAMLDEDREATIEILPNGEVRRKQPSDLAIDEAIRCCPFCGSHDVEISRTNKNACWVECAECCGRTDSAAKRADAIHKWNKRHFDDKPARIVFDDEEDR